jgi:hypothetical protein
MGMLVREGKSLKNVQTTVCWKRLALLHGAVRPATSNWMPSTCSFAGKGAPAGAAHRIAEGVAARAGPVRFPGFGRIGH